VKARYLRHAALEELRENVPDNLESYRSGSFGYLTTDSSKFFEGTFEMDDEKIAALRFPSPTLTTQYEDENCITCYEALADLSPYEARDERFWAYLTHTHLLDYARHRWLIPADDEAAIKYIRNHFFGRDKRQIERENAGSRLWWMAYMCRRVEGLSFQEALQVFLYRADVRANLVERPTVSQSTVVFNAMIKKLHQSYGGKKMLFDRRYNRPLMVRINSVGGVKLLDCLTQKQMSDLIDRVVEQDLGLAAI
jgi:hypothetical protein